MERKSRTSTSDLLTWTEAPPPDSSSSSAAKASNAHRSYPPSDGIRKVVFGGQVTDEEAEGLNKKKSCSGYKLKEMTGSGIFAANGKNDVLDAVSKTSVRIVQQALNGISQISFSAEESISPKKPTSIPEVAKQRELSGTLLSDSDANNKKQISNAKFKEISGHDIFAPAPEIVPRSLAATRSLESKESKDFEPPAPRNIRTSVKVSNPAGGQSNILFGEEPDVKTSKKINNQKFKELTGNEIFKGDIPPGSAEKSLSVAKLREMSGNDIFADGKAESRGYFGGVRKPPGGGSSIRLE